MRFTVLFNAENGNEINRDPENRDPNNPFIGDEFETRLEAELFAQTIRGQTNVGSAIVFDNQSRQIIPIN